MAAGMLIDEQWKVHNCPGSDVVSEAGRRTGHHGLSCQSPMGVTRTLFEEDVVNKKVFGKTVVPATRFRHGSQPLEVLASQ